MKKIVLIVAVLVVIVLAIPIVVSRLGNNDDTVTIEELKKAVEPTRDIIDFAEYQQIQEGMTYDEVYRIVGHDGEPRGYQSQGPLGTVKTYEYDNGGLSSASVTFRDGKVSSKWAWGLR